VLSQTFTVCQRGWLADCETQVICFRTVLSLCAWLSHTIHQSAIVG